MLHYFVSFGSLEGIVILDLVDMKDDLIIF